MVQILERNRKLVDILYQKLLDESEIEGTVVKDLLAEYGDYDPIAPSLDHLMHDYSQEVKKKLSTKKSEVPLNIGGDKFEN